jgi:AraC-like DNA-binding protein
MSQRLTEDILESFIDLMRLRNDENQFRRIPIDVENELLEKIRLGKYQEIKLPGYEKIVENLGVMASVTEITTYTYLVVSAVTLFTRTAIDCGVDADNAFDLSDALLLLLSNAKTLAEIHNIFQLSGVMFAKRVYQHSQRNHSYQVDKVCNYISRNIFHKITIDDIASHVDLSPNYISNLFAEVIGISIHNYIQREKIHIACNLLMHTDRPISEISVYIGFKTQSNFSVIFRKWEHMTPSEYRNKMYREVF